MRHIVAIDIVCLNEKKLKCKSKNIEFWSASSNSVTEWLPLTPQKQVASILFIALYSFMAAWQQTKNWWCVRGMFEINPKLGNKKSLGGRWALWCVRGVFETNPKLENKKSWCVLGMFETNPKLDNKPKTQQQTQNSETKLRQLWNIIGIVIVRALWILYF